MLTQYKSHSLDRHVTKTWRMSTMLGNYVAPVPAQQRVDKNWYLGSANAIFQSLNLVHDEKPDIVVVVGADHVYRMDFSQMVEQHIETGAGVTVAAIRQPISLADQFGVIEVDDADHRKIGAFLEKPKDAKGLPDSPDEVLASMGNYVFDADVLIDAVTRDNEREGSKHDMGGDIVPDFVDRGRGLRLRLQGQRHPRRDRRVTRPTGVTSGRWTPTGTRTWTSCRSTRSSTSTTTTGRSTPTTGPTRRPSSCTALPASSARRTTRRSPPVWSSPVRR